VDNQWFGLPCDSWPTQKVPDVSPYKSVYLHIYIFTQHTHFTLISFGS